MADSGRLELIHAAIDGELGEEQRGELARCLLADQEAMAKKDPVVRCRHGASGLRNEGLIGMRRRPHEMDAS